MKTGAIGKNIPETNRDISIRTLSVIFDIFSHIGIDHFQLLEILISRITSAVSLAISTAVSAEIPSATFIEGASLIPSPI